MKIFKVLFGALMMVICFTYSSQAASYDSSDFVAMGPGDGEGSTDPTF